MAFRGEFRNTSTGNSKNMFATAFEKFYKKFLNEEGSPSPEEDAALFKLFQTAYPNASDYIRSVFEDSMRTSQENGIPLPKIPYANILDLKETPLAGMGNSFFERLVHLNKISVQTFSQIDAEIARRKPRELPKLQLIMGVDLFDAIKIGSTNQIAKDKAGLASDFNGMQTGQVQSCKIISEVENKEFIHRKLARVKMESGAVIDLFIEGKDRGNIQTGDMIGVSNLKKSEGITSLLVPHTISQFLEVFEPNFRFQRSPKKEGQEHLSDEHQGRFILGTIVSGQPTDRKIAIIDKNNDIHEVRLDGLFKDFGLKEGDMFIAHPNKLDAEGVYKISPKDILKLDAPWTDRLIAGLPFTCTEEPVIKVTEANFAPTEQMPH